MLLLAAPCSWHKRRFNLNQFYLRLLLIRNVWTKKACFSAHQGVAFFVCQSSEFLFPSTFVIGLLLHSLTSTRSHFSLLPLFPFPCQITILDQCTPWHHFPHLFWYSLCIHTIHHRHRRHPLVGSNEGGLAPMTFWLGVIILLDKRIKIVHGKIITYNLILQWKYIFKVDSWFLRRSYGDTWCEALIHVQYPYAPSCRPRLKVLGLI